MPAKAGAGESAAGADGGVNRRVILAALPTGAPTLEDFRLDTVPVPRPGPGEVLLRTLWLSLDPYMRETMDNVAPIYSASTQIGEPMVGQTVSRVVTSNHSSYRPGELVLAQAGWQDYALSNEDGLMPLGDVEHPSRRLGVLGMPGFTAYFGLLEIGRPQPGETVVVAAATGAVGSVVGQVARVRGARAVGIAGGPQKCRYAVEELGFDACLDHHDPQFPERLASVCARGIDVYFENVGGPIFDSVLPLLNVGARIPLCGLIHHYNDTGGAATGPDRLHHVLQVIHHLRITVRGFIILDHYATHHDDFVADMQGWLAGAKVKAPEDVTLGLENAAAAFIGLLEGRNFGKAVVKVADA